MNEKQRMKRRIWELDFALHELTLFLDTHPNNAKALALVREFRKRREDVLAAYEKRFGPINATANTTDANTSTWNWIDGPWPWEKCFTEE